MKVAVFSYPKSSNYNTLHFPRKMFHEWCCFSCPKSRQTIIRYFSKGKCVMKAIIFSAPQNRQTIIHYFSKGYYVMKYVAAVFFSCPKIHQTIIHYFSKGKGVMKSGVFSFLPKKSSNYNTQFFQRKRCHDSCYLFLPKKSSNYITLLLQRKRCHEPAIFFSSAKSR